MELWNALAGLGAVAAAAVAVWAVIVAHRANARAKESNRIAEDSLEVARASHALNERMAPPAWTQAEPVDENRVKFTNQSGRHIVITSITAIPDESAADIVAPFRPIRVEHGDAFPVGWELTLASTLPQRLIFRWHFEDEPGAEHETERQL